MRKTWGAVLAAGSLMLWAATALPQQQPAGERLNAAQLRELLGDAVFLDGFSARGYRFSLILVPQDVDKGPAYNLWMDRHGVNYGQHQGTWRLQGDSLCTIFPTANVNSEQCAHHYRLGDGSYEARLDSDAKPWWSYRVRPVAP